MTPQPLTLPVGQQYEPELRLPVEPQPHPEFSRHGIPGIPAPYQPGEMVTLCLDENATWPGEFWAFVRRTVHSIHPELDGDTWYWVIRWEGRHG